MASPSQKPISWKLQVKPGSKLAIINAPNGYKEKIVSGLPKDASIVGASTATADVIQFFVKSKKELETNLPRIRPKLKTSGILWVTYPKGTSTIKADINRDVIRDYAPRIGMEAVAISRLTATGRPSG